MMIWRQWRDTLPARRACPGIEVTGRFTLTPSPSPAGRERGVSKSMSNTISIPREALAAFCQRHRIRKLSLFGSALRDDFRPDSDIDLLYEFQPGHTVGLGLIDLEDELSELLGGRKVDLVAEKYLNRYLRRRVLDSAEVLYEAR